MRLGVCTGGGDCPGLNAVIRAVVRGAASLPDPIEIIGIEHGFSGLLGEGSPHLLTPSGVRGILGRGGTILGTTNRGNPFSYPVISSSGDTTLVDRSADLVATVERLRLDGLIVIGGDGTLGIGLDIHKLGVPVVGVPKTIDNDLAATDQTFGFDSAVNVAVEALGRLKTTAESHDRMMVMEVMGRYAGWIALHAGVAGGAHAILLPEIPYSREALSAFITGRRDAGSNYHLIVVAEGAREEGGGYSTDAAIGASAGAEQRLGGAADRVAAGLKPIGVETRTLVLGHLQRGGAPTYRDRWLGTRYGAHAIALAAAGRFGRMVSLRGNDITDVGLEDALAEPKRVDPNGPEVNAARAVGIGFGDVCSTHVHAALLGDG